VAAGLTTDGNAKISEQAVADANLTPPLTEAPSSSTSATIEQDTAMIMMSSPSVSFYVPGWQAAFRFRPYLAAIVFAAKEGATCTPCKRTEGLADTGPKRCFPMMISCLEVCPVEQWLLNAR